MFLDAEIVVVGFEQATARPQIAEEAGAPPSSVSFRREDMEMAMEMALRSGKGDVIDHSRLR